MTVILVLLTVLLFITVDYLLERQRAAHAPAAITPRPAAPHDPRVASDLVWVSGYRLPGELAYHRGHTWALADENGATVGIDDFARQLVGPPERVELPRVGSHLKQGEPALEIALDGRSVALLSPVDGEVCEVNPRLADDPGLIHREPYGRGWLLKVRARDVGRSLRNLLSGSLAKRWMEDSRERLELQLVALSGSVLQDGGVPVADFARHLSDDEWRRLVRDLLLA